MRKKALYLIIISTFVGLLSTSCSTKKATVEQLNGTWIITEINGKKPTSERIPEMEFNVNEKRLHGNGGCNIFNTSFETDEKDASVLRIKPAATTMMACPDMETEDAVLKGMFSVSNVKASKSKDELLLTDEEGNTIFVLSKKTSDK